jgi:hypothetical protein
VAEAGTRIPVRSDERPTPVGGRRWLPTLAVAAVILSLTVGARAAADALEGPQAPAVDVAGLVSVRPDPGWHPVSRHDDEGAHDVLLGRGSARLLVVALEGFSDAPDALAEAYVDSVLQQRFVQVRLAPSPETTVVVGHEAVRFGYVGVTDDRVFVEGGVTAIVGSTGAGVVFDAFAPEGTLAASADDLHRMIDGAEVA